ncbi:DUF732 domain-containing protein [Streptosporangium sp. NPDC051022]|uniref:DUF732 domain-containing protein n=1 Tax=Streptosporangium sp. NPDC051022 TaxID=3155752 RepID=UPI00342FCA42
MHPPQQQPQRPPAPTLQYGPPPGQPPMGPPPGWRPPPPKERLSTLNFVLVSIGAVFVVTGLIIVLIRQTASTSPSISASPSNTPSGRMEVAKPTGPQGRAYVAALKEIDPGLAVNKDRAIRRGIAICDRMLNGMDNSKYSLPEYVVLELSGGHATINEEQARQVIQLVAAWCKAA